MGAHGAGPWWCGERAGVEAERGRARGAVEMKGHGATGEARAVRGGDWLSGQVVRAGICWLGLGANSPTGDGPQKTSQCSLCARRSQQSTSGRPESSLYSCTRTKRNTHKGLDSLLPACLMMMMVWVPHLEVLPPPAAADNRYRRANALHT